MPVYRTNPQRPQAFLAACLLVVALPSPCFPICEMEGADAGLLEVLQREKP